jgi:CRP-like cAMP-binding protein
MDPRDLPDITVPVKKRSIKNWITSLSEDPNTFGGEGKEISSLSQRQDVSNLSRAATEPLYTDDVSVSKSILNKSSPTLQRNDALLAKRNHGPGHRRHKTAVLETSAADKYLGTAATASSVRESLPRFIIHPLHPWYRFWWNLTVVVAAITSILEPYTIAFTPPGLYPYGSATSILEYICIILIAIDMVISFNVAVYRNGVLLTDRKILAKKYLKLIFIIDLISIIPFDEIALAIAGLNGSNSANNPIVAQYFSLLKLLRMLRCYRLLWFFSFLTFNLAAPLLLVTLLRNIYFTFFLANFAACAFYFEARQAGFSEFTWVGSDPTLFQGAGTSAMYIYSLYWSITTLSTTGYGDIAATNPVEAGLIAFWMLFLIFFTACEFSFENFFIKIYIPAVFDSSLNYYELLINYYFFYFSFFADIIGSITLLVVKNDERVGSYRDQMRSLQNYSAMHALPLSLRESMQRHLKLHFYNADAADEHVLKVYPSSIRRKVLRQLYNPTLRECYLFQGARPRFIDALLSVARVELYLPQVDILSSGDHVNELFIVAAGRLACIGPSANKNGGTAAGGGGINYDDISIRGGSVGISNTNYAGQAPYLQRRSMQSSYANTSTAAVGEERADSVVVNVDGGDNGGGGPGSYLSTEDPSFHHGNNFNNNTSTSNPANTNNNTSVRFIEEGDTFGELAFFTGTSQLETIKTQTTCRVLAIGRAAFEQVATSFPASKKRLLMHLARREEDATLDLFPGPEGVRVFNKAMAEESRGGDGVGGGDGSFVTAADGSGTILPGDINVAAEDPTWRLNPRKAAELRLNLQQQLAVGSLLKLKGIVASAVAKHDADRLTLWMYAAARGDIAKIREMLFNHGCDPNMADYDQRTALMLASARGFRDVVTVLLSASANPNTEDTFGGTALFEACKHGHDDIIDLLVKSGAKLGVVEGSAKQEKMASLLCSTVHSGDLKLLRRLLRAGADVNAADYDGRTALHIAAAEGNVPAVELLVVEGGADVEKRDRWGATAGEEARRVGARGVEMFLLAEAEALLEKQK